MILVHELGHFLAGKLLGFKVDKIEIYPYGGCSKMSYDINTSFLKEFLVFVMGPLFQLIFVLIIYYLNIEVPAYFYTYNLFILGFNLLPIYPLDGGKLLHLIFTYFISYYNSLKIIIYISYFIFISLFIVIILKINLISFLIIILLGKQLFKEMNQVNYYYNKFLLERYLNKYRFNKVKTIFKLKQMKRYYYHYFIIANKLISEKTILNKVLATNYPINKEL